MLIIKTGLIISNSSILNELEYIQIYVLNLKSETDCISNKRVCVLILFGELLNI